MKNMYSIGEVARLLGVSTQTLRKYERAGLLRMPRSDKNYRHFEAPDITMLMRIRLMRNLGFSLDEISRLVSQDCTEREQLYDQRIEKLKQEISHL